MKIESNVSDEIINNALIGAREGATCYWAQSRLFDPNKRKDIKLHLNPLEGRYFVGEGKYDGEELWLNSECGNKALSFFEEENPEIELFVTHCRISRGLLLMSEKYPKHFADLIGENDDATTHDVFLQCCLLNNVIYG